ncbi:hypothetical protein J3A83DRAFT_4188997 [Scleroderma citrinum]
MADATYLIFSDEFPNNVNQSVTLNRSIPAVIIGGEPSSPLVVVDDLPEFVPVPDGHRSTANPLGPGCNIFAQQEVKKAKSLPPVSAASRSEENERVVSVVGRGRKARIVLEALGEEASESLEKQQESIFPKKRLRRKVNERGNTSQKGH